MSNDKTEAGKAVAKEQKHIERQKKIKAKVDKRIALATEERGVFVVITGNGKGKSTSGFGTVLRAIGHGQKAGTVQLLHSSNELLNS